MCEVGLRLQFYGFFHAMQTRKTLCFGSLQSSRVMTIDRTTGNYNNLEQTAFPIV